MGAEFQADAIKAIYDASLSGSRWRPALDAIQAGTHAKASILYHFHSLEDLTYRVDVTSSGLRHAGRTVERYNRLVKEGRGSNFDREGLSAVHSKPVYEVLRDEDIWKIDAAYTARPEVALTRAELGILRRFVVNLSDDPGTMSGMIFMLGREHDAAIPQEDLRFVGRVAPHLGKAIELNRLTQPLRMKYSAVLAVLDRIAVPICLALADGSVILKNRAAENLLAARDAIWLDRSGRFVCRERGKTREIAAAIVSAAATANGEGEEGAAELELANEYSGRPVYAVVSPLRDGEMELEAGLAGAIVTFIDGAHTATPRIDVVTLAYGLTPCEERLARILLKGGTNAEMAEVLGTSPETVKKQVASIYAKTGCRNRIGFVWRVFQFSPPIE